MGGRRDITRYNDRRSQSVKSELAVRLSRNLIPLPPTGSHGHIQHARGNSEVPFQPVVAGCTCTGQGQRSGESEHRREKGEGRGVRDGDRGRLEVDGARGGKRKTQLGGGPPRMGAGGLEEVALSTMAREVEGLQIIIRPASEGPTELDRQQLDTDVHRQADVPLSEPVVLSLADSVYRWTTWNRDYWARIAN
ncbi:hypothetical protein KM043_016435 [Ampulex compressa]|nr:hypothetical protein KM043_016435 [Ampulex compressa]